VDLADAVFAAEMNKHLLYEWRRRSTSTVAAARFR